jgi:chromate transporter
VSEIQLVPQPSVSLLQIGGVFLRIGTTAFGGLGATLALIHRELVEERRLLTPEQMTEALTFTKPLPGATAFQVVSYLGYRLGGWPGSAIAAIAFVLPPMIGMFVMARLFGLVHALPRFPAVLSGLVAAVVGLLLATTYRMGNANVKGLVSLLIALTAFASATRFQVNGALVVVIAGVIGLLAFMPPFGSSGQSSVD